MLVTGSVGRASPRTHSAQIHSEHRNAETTFIITQDHKLIDKYVSRDSADADFVTSADANADLYKKLKRG